MKGDEFSIGHHVYIEVYRRECRGPTCNATIVMARNSTGSWHPFDPDTGDSHYATCPDADNYRRRKGET